jgi:putative acetyltransferase
VARVRDNFFISANDKIGMMHPPVDAITRCERIGDTQEQSAIRSVNEAAFGRSDEADLVDNLRREGVILLSFVAEMERRIVGHLLFSQMSIETGNGPVPAAALAPIAVLPDHQRRGIGEKLIRNGLDFLRERGERIVIVLGHPGYYARFGFSSGMARSLESPFPPEAFMALELRSGALEGIRGKVRYPSSFGL